MTFLSLKNLAKSFGDFVAVNGLSLDLERGEFISLLGPSGCGKTTILQMIAGFLTPTTGNIILEGQDITQLRPERRGMGVVFQSYALFPHMTVAGNISFGLEMRGMDTASRQSRVSETLELVRLKGLGNRFPRELSGGQRQRVAIARALAIRPELLLLDEPMSNLDAKLREEMHIELRGIQKHLGITTLLVTHDQVEAMTMSDRIAVMHGGKIVQLSRPYEAYEEPRSAFASKFLGKTNALKGKVIEIGPENILVDVGGERLDLPHRGQRFSGDVQVYIRPEKISISTNGANLTGTALSGLVSNRLFLGNNWMLQVDTAVGQITVSTPNVGQVPPCEGERVALSWADQDVRILAGSGGLQ